MKYNVRKKWDLGGRRLLKSLNYQIGLQHTSILKELLEELNNCLFDVNSVDRWKFLRIKLLY